MITTITRRLCGPAVIALISLAGPALAAPAEVSLSGEGQVRYVPDSARLSFTVTAQHADSDRAISEVRGTIEQWRESIAELRDQLVDYTDASAHLYQRQHSPRQQDGEPGEPRTIAVASQTISFEIHDLELLNPVLTKAQNLGMNYNLGQHQFFHSDEEALQREALARAIDDARERCQFAAQQLDMACGQVRSLNLQSSGGGPIMMRMQEASATADTVSQVGPREVSATVQATFTMK
ncbi:SIMPL domain-containing protein [Marinobacter zhanjiangensis]|uniref:SIMPL domain-containing protein n=1 Tax=Marinobacter zhanjiangensis TaxID=578215 RepID=A0ABQ3ATC2_9GAMM|nr:SIMPL domain-containing protein [Marinobacter zhanjiangensis]GGY63489.1 SIMPL domain-containing protein [Marinobacter zhanjiangensis]